MSKIMVIGTLGFHSHALMSKLQSEGHDVVVVDSGPMETNEITLDKRMKECTLREELPAIKQQDYFDGNPRKKKSTWSHQPWRDKRK